MKLAALFCDNMVLQRNQVAPIWGWDKPGTAIRVELGQWRAVAITAADGRWQAKLPPMPAGGPFKVIITGTAAVTLSNVMIGEVWVCSGQSNMEWPLSLSTDAASALADGDYPNIRLFTVKKTAELEPQSDVVGQWDVCTADTAPAFSAVGYYFGRKLHRVLGVSVGLINSSWGGTLAEAWTSREGLEAEPSLRPMVEKYDETLKDVDGSAARHKIEYKAWQDRHIPSDPGNSGHAKGWGAASFDDAGWETMALPGAWQGKGHNYSGVFWFRREVDVPAAWAGRDLTLSLGPTDKSDITYFNNVQVGSITMEQRPDAWCTPRTYTIAGSLVKAGRNVVAVRVFSNIYGGGFIGLAGQMKLSAADGEAVPLAGPWRFKVEHNFGLVQPPPAPAAPPGNGNPNSPYVLYSSMIQPLVPFGIRGAIWYQGESNADRAAQYRTLFPAMIRSWRKAWNQGDFPFHFVQLANWQPVKDQPAASQWAELREAQTMTLSLPNTGQAVIIDVGDAEDIHPRNKTDVGDRLALGALANTYGFGDLVYSGPLFQSFSVEGDKVRVSFSHVGGGLRARGGPLKGFALAGEDKKFVWADAKIDGQGVVVSCPRVTKPLAVRYAWADNPVCNLYNVSGLPASPFRTDSWDGV